MKVMKINNFFFIQNLTIETKSMHICFCFHHFCVLMINDVRQSDINIVFICSFLKDLQKSKKMQSLFKFKKERQRA